jgi:hypothetical protein
MPRGLCPLLAVKLLTYTDVLSGHALIEPFSPLR